MRRRVAGSAFAAVAALAGAGFVAQVPAPGEITIDYPLDGSVFPPEIAAPTILWHDPSPEADAWLVRLDFAGDAGSRTVPADVRAPRVGSIDERCVAVTNEPPSLTPYQASAKAWRPSPDLWSAIRRDTVDRPVVMTVLGFRKDRPEAILSRGVVRFETSSDPVGAPIFYRDVPLMPSAGKDGVIKPLDQTASPLIAWRLKDVGRDDSRLLLSDMPTCANCHSFSADGKTLAMDLDGPDGDKGAYAIATIGKNTVIDNGQVMTWNAFEGRPKDRFTLGFLARISPDGRNVLATVNEALYVRNFTDYRILQVFYPTRGILAWYSRDTGLIRALPGADDTAYVHCDPVWSPDGKTIVFCRARARHPYDPRKPVADHAGDPNETPIQYDLYRMPFRDGRGGVPEPLLGASNDGSSHSFPKITPDGKWVVFVRSRNGQLLRPDGKLWIVPVAGGEARLMRCNTSLMNSWHSFSPNGRWMVFSSKVNTPYTQMFLTHLDATGNDTPPILIENATAANRAVNIPEFVNVGYDDFEKITVPAIDHYESFHRGTRLARAGQSEKAVAEFEKALEDAPQDWRITDWRIHDGLSKTLMKLGRADEALVHIRESLRLNPDNAEMEGNYGYLLFQMGQLAEARRHLDAAVRLAPKDPRAWFNHGSVRRTVGDAAGAVEDYSQAIALDGNFAAAFQGRGSARMTLGELGGARADLDRAIALDPNDPASWYYRAQVRAVAGDLRGALDDADRAADLVPPGTPQRGDIDALRGRIRDALVR